MNLNYNIKACLFFLCTLFCLNKTGYAQCNLKPVLLQERVRESSLIVEGMVVAQKAVWDDRRHNIYTIYTVEVLSVFKGTTNDTLIYIVAPGGVVGMDMHITTHSLELNEGKTGLFTLIPTNDPVTTPYPLYEAYAGTQGFIRYEKASRKAIGVFDKYTNIESELYGQLKTHTHSLPRRNKSIPWKKVNDHSYSLRENVLGQREDHHEDGELHLDMDSRLVNEDPLSATISAPISASATISSFSPSNLSAGIFSQLTINGTGFGATQGTSYVMFPNSDDGGTTFITPVASHYISWSDTKIVVEVPTKAGTGKFKVSDGTNTVTAATNLTIDYAILNVNSSASGTSMDYRGNHINANSSGGYTYQMSTAFDANTSAKTDFQNLVYQWRCATGINWIFGASTSNNTTASDGINVVRFDTGSELSAGTLGLATSRFSGCLIGASVYWYVSEVDVQVDDGANFFYGSSGTPSGSQYDFYSVMLHEMGHAHQLSHVIDATKLMHYNLAAGVQKRTISSAELTGASYQLSQSIAAGTTCSKTVHIDYSCNPSVTLSVGSTSISETGGSTTVTATLSKRNFSDVTVTIAFTGTATTTTDYTLTTSIVVPAGSLSASLTLASVGDTKYEGNETVIVDISNVTNGSESGAQQQTVTITDDDTAPTVTLSVGGTSIAENAGTTTVTATLSAASGLVTTVSLAFTGTATVTTDYTLATSIVIPAGSLSASIALTSVTDTKYEGNETVIIDISNVTNGNESSAQQQTVTITDDDAMPTVTLTTGATSINEASGSTTVTATLSAASGLATTVSLAFTGTATVTTDYTLATSIVIAAGTTSASVTLTSVGDALYEGNETVIVDISNVTNGNESTLQQKTVTIADDDAMPTVTLTTAATSISETSGSTTVTATLSAVSGLATTVTLAFTGTATVTTDYTLATSIVIAAGSSSASVTLTSVGDALYEGSETVIVDISNVTNATESAVQQKTVTITDDDLVPTVTLSTGVASISETSGSTTVTATLSAVSGLATTVSLSFTGTAILTTDYTLPASIVIAAGSTSGFVTLASVSDTKYEGNETVIIDISNVTNGNELSSQQQTVTIADDDTAPSVTLTTGATSISETSGSTTVTATLSAVSGLATTVNVSFSGTATVAGDYTLSNSITIAAGSTSAFITLASVGDILYEGNETVIMDISSVTNGTESGIQQQTVTITEDDVAPTVTLSTLASSIPENGGSTTVKATLSAVSGLATTVSLSFSGTATVTTDYTLPTSIIVPAGSTSASITLASATDVLIEGDETVTVDISNVTNGTESGVQQQIITIVDNPLPYVTLSSGTSSIVEASGSTTVTATLSSVYLADVTVTISFTGTAISTADYTLASAIVIPAGSSSASVTLSSISDLLYEGNETIIVDITSVTNGIESGIQQQTIVLNDDDAAPAVSLTTGATSVSETSGATTVTATLSAVSGLPVTVTLAVSGTAVLSNDYTLSSTVTIPAGSISASVILTSVSDLIDEDDETVILAIASVTNGTEDGIQQQTVTILDDDAAPSVTLSITPSNIVETGGTATITATLSSVSSKNINVSLSASGTAAITDYSFSGTTVSITAGSTVGSVTVSASGDVLDELDETIIVDIFSVTNATESGVQQQTVTILDDDAAPSVALSVGASSVLENGSTTVIAALSAVSGLDVTVTWSFSGTAIENTDYSVATSVTIPAGTLSSSVTITAVNDLLYEGNESVLVDITSVTNGTEAGSQQSTISVLDDDAAPSVSLSATALSIAENGGVSTITASLSEVSGLEVVLDLGYTGTAVYGTDYSGATQMVIPAGSTMTSIVVTSLDDLLDDDGETIVPAIISVNNGTANATPITIVIADDENPEINVRVSSVQVPNNTDYDFGAIPVGTNSTVTFTVENTGTGTLNLTDAALVTLSGANASDYALDLSSLNSSVPAGGMFDFTLTFTSVCGSAKAAQLKINNNDSDEASYVVNVTAVPTENSAPVPNVAILNNIVSQCVVTLTAPTATDNCSGTVTATTNDPVVYNQMGSYTVTWMYTDGYGNTSSQTQQITIEQDVTDPQIVCPSNVVTNDPTVVYVLPTATDNCSNPALTLISGLASGSVFPFGNTTVTYAATDLAGNVKECSFTVTVNEVTSVETSSDILFRMYPNPVADYVVLENMPNGVMLNIYDHKGMIVLSKNNVSWSETLHVGGWAQGVYMVQLVSGTKVNSYKLEVAK